MRLVVVAILAAIGGVALWSGLDYSSSHGASFIEQQPVPRQVSSEVATVEHARARLSPSLQSCRRRPPPTSPCLRTATSQGLDGGFEEEPAASGTASAVGEEAGAKSETHANLETWTKLTTELPGTGDGAAGRDAVAVEGAGAGGAGSDAAVGSSAAAGSQGFVTVQLRVPKARPGGG